MQETEAFITVKDHKEGFPHTLSFRLINPSKSDIGKINKSILDKINKAIVSKTSVNQWKNTSDVVKWFKNIPEKRVSSFVNFDVENFYPSILIKLFTDSIKYAKNLIEITDQNLAIIMQARKTLLFQNTEPWVQKSGTEDFDVPMGCYDGAEVCELVGSYMLNQLKHDMNKESIGLYRDDGLGVFHNIPKPEIERKKKQIVKRFKECGLSITIQCNLKSVDFLDVTFDLYNNLYKPYRKPNNKPIYINKQSNHPPNVLKQLPKSIAKRISDTSSSKDIFDKSISIYQNALYESGFKEELKYTPSDTSFQEENDQRTRRRKIIWFNPPYSKSVKTNIGKNFLHLLVKHFPTNNKMHKIFNKNTVKVSYSCMKNMDSIISGHNHNILNPKQRSFGCNCRKKDSCPLNGECLTPKVIYHADVTNEANNDQKFYFGLAETTFKERYNNHKRDVKHIKYQCNTELNQWFDDRVKNIWVHICWLDF